MTRLLSRSLVGLVAVVAMGACSDDSSSGGGTGGSTAIGATGGAGGSGGGVSSGCTVACGVNQVCNPTLNACVCSPTAINCGAGCQDITSTATSCGSCTTVCDASVPLCSGGLCVATCDAALGLQQCGTGCVNISSDPNNCGSCSTICPSGQCVANACVPVAGTGGATGTGGTTSTTTGGTTSAPTGGTTSTNTGGSTATGGTTETNTGGTTETNTGGTTETNTGGTTETNTGGTTSSDGGTSDTGGTTEATGGTTEATGGTTEATGGTTTTGTPDGYWTYEDWHGCVWTGTDSENAGTTITPQDFTAGNTDGSFCVTGNVAATEGWMGVALLGFNLNQDAATADCSYVPVDTSADGPPSVQLTATGLAFSFAKGANTGTTDFILRAQIQGPDGGKEGDVGAADRWCATILATEGPGFIPWSDFNTQCWEGGDGTDYNGEDISAVVFTVPGNGWEEGASDTSAEDVSYDFCIGGIAAGESEADAPTSTVIGAPETGTIGETSTSDRAKVTVDGESYIIQNNAWGNGSLQLDYDENSFVVSGGTGSNNPAPASFPSIYIGGNGFTNEGAYDTRATDNLPKQVSTISSIQTSFAWSGSTGSFNATYDVWFASSAPTDQYNDGLDGFMMIWVHDPGGSGSPPQPIGSDVGDEDIAGVTWDVWTGPRGDGPEGYNDAPVVSFVARSDITSKSFDMMDFIDKATSYGLSASMYLTDVFFGFEIWDGGSGGNLSVDEFTCVVN